MGRPSHWVNIFELDILESHIRKMMTNNIKSQENEQPFGVLRRIRFKVEGYGSLVHIRIFEQQIKDIAALRYKQNEEFFVRMFKDEEFMSKVIRLLLPEVYRKLRKK
ncbi:MAG: hypothetical protein CVU87_13355 [Firmicutes bacterium HGW-Firmicutes-12]|nr:MAG: hypothetical protein CVU87_13355 [Firmicutes bacterium HGW-Firmicutes-12]